MGKITGFMEIERRDRPYAPVAERVKVYKEFIRPLPDAGDERSRARAAWTAASRSARPAAR